MHYALPADLFKLDDADWTRAEFQNFNELVKSLLAEGKQHSKRKNTAVVITIPLNHVNFPRLIAVTCRKAAAGVEAVHLVDTQTRQKIGSLGSSEKALWKALEHDEYKEAAKLDAAGYMSVHGRAPMRWWDPVLDKQADVAAAGPSHTNCNGSCPPPTALGGASPARSSFCDSGTSQPPWPQPVGNEDVELLEFLAKKTHDIREAINATVPRGEREAVVNNNKARYTYKGNLAGWEIKLVPYIQRDSKRNCNDIGFQRRFKPPLFDPFRKEARRRMPRTKYDSKGGAMRTEREIKLYFQILRELIRDWAPSPLDTLREKKRSLNKSSEEAPASNCEAMATPSTCSSPRTAGDMELDDVDRMETPRTTREDDTQCPVSDSPVLSSPGAALRCETTDADEPSGLHVLDTAAAANLASLQPSAQDREDQRFRSNVAHHVQAGANSATPAHPEFAGAFAVGGAPSEQMPQDLQAVADVPVNTRRSAATPSADEVPWPRTPDGRSVQKRQKRAGGHPRCMPESTGRGLERVTSPVGSIQTPTSPCIGETPTDPAGEGGPTPDVEIAVEEELGEALGRHPIEAPEAPRDSLTGRSPQAFVGEEQIRGGEVEGGRSSPQWDTRHLEQQMAENARKLETATELRARLLREKVETEAIVQCLAFEVRSVRRERQSARSAQSEAEENVDAQKQLRNAAPNSDDRPYVQALEFQLETTKRASAARLELLACTRKEEQARKYLEVIDQQLMSVGDKVDGCRERTQTLKLIAGRWIELFKELDKNESEIRSLREANAKDFSEISYIAETLPESILCPD